MDFSQAVAAVRARLAALFEVGDAARSTPDFGFDLRDIEEQLTQHRSGLFLGIYTEEFARRALEERGLLAAIRERTGADCVVRLHPDEGILRIYRADRPEGPDALLVESKAHVERSGVGPASASRPASFPHVDLLILDWMLLQDPGRPFPPGRRPLPGQRHPGLGIGPQALDAITAAGRRLEVAGVIGTPMYYHNALMYRRSFAFVDPVEEGRFQALRRDLAALSFEDAAFAVHEGRVFERMTISDGDEATVQAIDQPVVWRGREMVLPLGPEVRAYLDSPGYVDAAARTLLRTHFEVRPPAEGA